MLQDLIQNLAHLIREYSWTICLAWTASLLTIYGDELVKFTKRIARAWNFIFRVLFFVLVCGFGFGALTVIFARFIHNEMISLNNLPLVLAVLVAYLILGLLAERNNVI